MHVIIQTSDPVLVSYVEALLTDAGISFYVADEHVSSVEGSISAFPRRVMVADGDCGEAIHVLREAGLGSSLVS
jgi:hypothetical protein